MSRSSRRDFAHGLAALAALVAASSEVGCGECSDDDVGGPVPACYSPQQLIDAGVEPAAAGSYCSDGAWSSASFYLEAFDAGPGGNLFDIVSGPVNEGGLCCYVIQALRTCE